MIFVYLCLHDLFWEFLSMYVGRLSHFIFSSDFPLIKIKGGYQRIPTGRLVSVCAAVVPIETQQITYSYSQCGTDLDSTYLHASAICTFRSSTRLQFAWHAGMTWSNGRLLRFCDETFGHPSMAERNTTIYHTLPNSWKSLGRWGFVVSMSAIPRAASRCLFCHVRPGQFRRVFCMPWRAGQPAKVASTVPSLPQNSRQFAGASLYPVRKCLTLWRPQHTVTYRDIPWPKLLDQLPEER
jgi:hypothetical protein